MTWFSLSIRMFLKLSLKLKQLAHVGCICQTENVRYPCCMQDVSDNTWRQMRYIFNSGFYKWLIGHVIVSQITGILSLQVRRGSRFFVSLWELNWETPAGLLTILYKSIGDKRYRYSLKSIADTDSDTSASKVSAIPAIPILAHQPLVWVNAHKEQSCDAFFLSYRHRMKEMAIAPHSH